MFAKTGVEQKVEIGVIEQGQPSRRKYVYIHSFSYSCIKASSHISYMALTFKFSASTSVFLVLEREPRPLSMPGKHSNK